jgi:hypothetical protein
MTFSFTRSPAFREVGVEIAAFSAGEGQQDSLGPAEERPKQAWRTPASRTRARRRGRSRLKAHAENQFRQPRKLVECERYRSRMLRRATTVDHPCHRRLDVDPIRRVRKPERSNETLARQNGIGRRHQHARGRQIDDAITDESEIPLANDLTRDMDSVAQRRPAIRNDTSTHRSLHERHRKPLSFVGAKFATLLPHDVAEALK